MMIRSLKAVALVTLIGISIPAVAATVSVKVGNKTVSINTSRPIHLDQVATSKGIDAQALLNALINDYNVVVDVFAEWCGPCKQMSPILDTIAKSLPNTVIIVKIDVFSPRSIRAELC